jgi:hypothetical protein
MLPKRLASLQSTAKTSKSRSISKEIDMRHSSELGRNVRATDVVQSSFMR